MGFFFFLCYKVDRTFTAFQHTQEPKGTQDNSQRLSLRLSWKLLIPGHVLASLFRLQDKFCFKWSKKSRNLVSSSKSFSPNLVILTNSPFWLDKCFSVSDTKQEFCGLVLDSWNGNFWSAVSWGICYRKKALLIFSLKLTLIFRSSIM